MPKLIKHCQYCGNEFQVYRHRKTKYCSRECSQLAHRNRVQKNCKQCGANFEVRAYRKDEAEFCSKSCNAKYYAHQKDFGSMGNTFEKGNQLRKGLKPTNAFKSEDVSGSNNPQWKPPTTRVCEMCGDSFEIPHWRLNEKTHKGRFCSIECRAAYQKQYQSGENNPRYVGGVKTSRGRGWKKIRLIIILKQGGKCAHCGKFVGFSLPIHHIIPFRVFDDPKEANELNNLIGLCQPCHMKEEHKPSS